MTLSGSSQTAIRRGSTNIMGACLSSMRPGRSSCSAADTAFQRAAVFNHPCGWTRGRPSPSRAGPVPCCKAGWLAGTAGKQRIFHVLTTPCLFIQQLPARRPQKRTAAVRPRSKLESAREPPSTHRHRPSRRSLRSRALSCLLSKLRQSCCKCSSCESALPWDGLKPESCSELRLSY